MVDKIKNIINNKINSDILLLGKGASLDEINLNELDKFLIISVNDSEDIFRGDFCVFRHKWVSEKINNYGPKSSLYITNQKLRDDINSYNVKYIDELPENSKTLQKNILSKTLLLDRAILVSALRLALKCIEFGSRARRILLIGFDFTSQNDVSKYLKNPFHFEDQQYESFLIQNQKKIFEKILSIENVFPVPIQHVGTLNFSIYTPSVFNRIFFEKTYRSTKSLSIKNKIDIVAELTTNHFGNSDRLKSMIVSAADAGANYIKIQKRDVASFYSKEKLSERYDTPFGNTFGDYRYALELDEAQFEMVDEICKKLGIKWFASILDIKSFDFIRKFNPNIIKLPSTISQHKELLEYVSKNYNKDLVISTGFEDQQYQEKIIKLFKNVRTLYLLQTTSSYPTPGDEAQIGVVRYYHKLSQKYKFLKAGFSSHDLGSLGSMLAIAAGAEMVEKHVKLGSAEWAHFDDVAVDLINGDFKKYVNDLRKAELMIGSEIKKIQPSEHHKYFIK